MFRTLKTSYSQFHSPRPSVNKGPSRSGGRRSRPCEPSRSWGSTSGPGGGGIALAPSSSIWHKPGHLVTADEVRAMYGVLTLHQNVSKAVVTTSSRFAPGVYDEFKPVMP